MRTLNDATMLKDVRSINKDCYTFSQNDATILKYSINKYCYTFACTQTEAAIISNYV